jgi:hypothetical protein
MPPIGFKGEPPLLLLVTGEGLEACTLLLEEFWTDLATKIPGEVVIAVPNRDMVFVTSSTSEEGLPLLRDVNDEAREQAGRHGLSEHLYVWRDKQWVVYVEPDAAQQS